jgi:hypothetical protein
MAKYDIATVEKKYKVTLPARVKKFLTSELAMYKGATLTKVPDRNLNEYNVVVFGSASLFDSNLFDKKAFPMKVPFAALADASGSWRLELVLLECGPKDTGSLYFGKAFADADGNAPKIRPLEPNLDAFLKTLAIS